jgi:elongation factor Tu
LRQGQADVVLPKKDDGGRKRPCTSGYTPQFCFGATDVPGTLAFEAPFLEPGSRVDVTFELGRPIALEPGMRFAMREGGRRVRAAEHAGLDHELLRQLDLVGSEALPPISRPWALKNM